MKKVVLVFFSLFQLHVLMAQGPLVPSEMQFADIRLKIHEGARKEIQEDVDAMVQSTRYFQDKVNRMRLYFPIIERVLAEENVPDDVKYLVIQESALIPDAVSTSKAVGYWQFKDFTAVEMGLRVDSHIDERMNIVSSTRAAAKYFKKNNFYFNNWLNALQAYQMGAGAALKVISEKERGARSMSITKNTYWYVKKFLAHKVAYEHELMKQSFSDRQLIEYNRSEGKSLKNIAEELRVEEEELAAFNPWLKRGKIPGDKLYTVIVPVSSSDVSSSYVAVSTKDDTDQMDQGRNAVETDPGYDGLEDPDSFPVITENSGLFSSKSQFVRINRIPGIIGKEEHTVEELAERAGISESRFRTFNEILPHESIKAGQVYYFKKKKAKAKVHYHTLMKGESLWDVSQKYGIKLSKLLKKNRIKDEYNVKPGMVLWLRYVRPADEPIIIREVPEILVSEDIQKETTDPDAVPEKVEDIDIVNEKKRVESPIIQASPPDTEIEDILDYDEDRSLIDDDPLVKTNEIKLLHEVLPKETLYAISKKYGVEVLEIVNWNQLNIADGIRSGQILEIWVQEDWEKQIMEESVPKLDYSDEEFIEYRVQPGDTLYAIANKYGVTISDIQAWNDKKDISVSIGEKLRIKR